MHVPRAIQCSVHPCRMPKLPDTDPHPWRQPPATLPCADLLFHSQPAYLVQTAFRSPPSRPCLGCCVPHQARSTWRMRLPAAWHCMVWSMGHFGDTGHSRHVRHTTHIQMAVYSSPGCQLPATPKGAMCQPINAPQGGGCTSISKEGRHRHCAHPAWRCLSLLHTHTYRARHATPSCDVGSSNAVSPCMPLLRTTTAASPSCRLGHASLEGGSNRLLQEPQTCAGGAGDANR